jgi:uncharacterized membrane protein
MLMFGRANDPNKLRLTGIVLFVFLAIHFCMVAAVNCGLDVPEPYRMLWVYSVMVPMIVAWVALVIDPLIWPY